MKIFVSYSRRDAGDFANQIQRHLSSFKYDIFTDVDSIRAGEVWSNTITTNISSCDIFVVIVTYGSLQSAHVENEVLHAKRENKKIIPCFFRGIITSKIKWGLENIQGVEFDDKYELARNLYSKIDVESYIPSDKDTKTIFEPTSKPIEETKSITDVTNTNITTPTSIKSVTDKLQQKKDTIQPPSLSSLSSSSSVRTGAIGGSGIPSLSISSKLTEKTKNIATTTNSIPFQSDTDKIQQKKDTDNYSRSEVQTPKSPINLKIILPIIGVIAAILLVVMVFVNPFGSNTPSDNIVSEPLPPNSLPIASNKSITTAFNTPIDIALEVRDNDGNRDKLTTTIVTNPYNGTLSNIDPNTNKVTYTPNQDFVGTAIFTYKVSDGTVDSPEATVTITVNPPPNQPPTAEAVTDTVVQGQSKDITLKASDPDTDDILQFSINNEPQNGQLGEINQESDIVTYTPNKGYIGPDTFTYKVNDGTADSNSAVVTVTVSAPPNSIPNAVDKSVTTTFNSPVGIALEATDENVDDELTATIVTQPENGTLGEINQTNGIVTYTPNLDFVGTDTFTYKVNDGTADSNNAVVTVTVSGPPNAVPIASDKSVTTSSGTAVGITLEATDENVDDELTATIVTQPEHGTLGTIDQSTGIVTYTPDDNYNGKDSFTYRVNDGKSDSNKASITITVEEK